MIYLYNYAGQPWKTQSRVRLSMKKLYQAAPDSLYREEDNGQMSGWYVFSTVGFYPVCPGTSDYDLGGSPLFQKATLRLAGGKRGIPTLTGPTKTTREPANSYGNNQ